MAKLIQMPAPPDPFELLNPQQRAAVTHGDGPLLVVAGAGTGKTRVIIERIRFLLENRPEISGENILGLTFTDKAAEEMKNRVVAAVGDRAQEVTLATFHQFCTGLLLDLNPGMKILEPTDHWILMRRNLSRLQLNKYKRLAQPGKFLSDFEKFFSRCQDELVTPDDYEQYVTELERNFAAESDALEEEPRAERELEIALEREVARAYRVSTELLRERNQYAFGGLLLESVRLLRSTPELVARLRKRYHYVLVDEFQDTNIAQIELLWLIAGVHRNIVGVGDDDQAIYRFRGASFGSFQIFMERFAADHQEKAQRVRLMLEQNYRSTRRILRVAGLAISQNKDRFLPDKKLISESAEGEKIRIVTLDSKETEARWVAGELVRMNRDGIRWGDCAVLYRKHALRDELVDELRRREIPFVIRNLSVLENGVVRDLLAYLRLIATRSDSVSCARVLACPAWGLEARDLVRLAERAKSSKGCSLWDALVAAHDDPAMAGKLGATSELVEFAGRLHKRAKHALVSELLEEMLAELRIGLLPKEADRRALERFVGFVGEWEAKSETKSLAEFVEYFDYFLEAGGKVALAEQSPGDAVQLMTVHAAKGLEFSHVFVIRMVNRSFPDSQKRPVLEFPAELMKEARPDGDFHIQEERRLFYVALTRARRSLTLTTVVAKRSKPSPFLEDLLDPTIQHSDVWQLSPRVAETPPQFAVEEGRTGLFLTSQLESRIFSQVAEWAQTFHPPLPEPLKLSASAIESYDACPQKFLFNNVWGLRGGPAATLTFGNVMHTAVATVVRELRQNPRLPLETVQEIFLREWKSAGYQDAYQEKEYKEAGLEQLQAFYESCRAEPPTVLHQEKQFELSLDGDVIVTGRIDQINQTGPNRLVEIVDYKTGSPKNEKDAEKSLQLSLYALAAREQLELKPERLTFYNLTTNEAVSVPHNDADVEEALDEVAEVAADLRARSFPAKPGFLCRYCDFRALCPEHEEP